MSTAASVLAARVLAQLKDTTVATAAGIASGTWASATVARVFRGIGATCLGKSRGRLPFLEFDVEGLDFTQTSPEGGTLRQRVRIVAHCGGRDQAVASELLVAILTAGLAAVRAVTADNLTALGDDRIGELAGGPWGHSREASMTVEQSYERATYEGA